MRTLHHGVVFHWLVLSLWTTTVQNAYTEERPVGFLLFDPIYGESAVDQKVFTPTINRVAVVSFVATNAGEGVRAETPDPSGKSSFLPLYEGQERSISSESKPMISQLRKMNLEPSFSLGVYDSASFQSGLKVFTLRARALIATEDEKSDVSIMAFVVREWTSLLTAHSTLPPIFGDYHSDLKNQSLKQLAEKIQKEPSEDDLRDFFSLVLSDFVGMKIANVEVGLNTMTISFDFLSKDPEFELGLFQSFFEPLSGIKSAQQDETLKP